MLIKNLTWLTRNPSSSGQAAAGSTAQVGQSAVSKIISGRTKQAGYRTVAGLARHYGYSVDDLVFRDLERDGPSVPSQPARPDTAKLANLIESVECVIVDDSLNFDARLKARVVAAVYANSGNELLTRQAVRAALFAALSSQESP